MRILIPLRRDSDNSYVTGELEFIFTPNIDTVSIQIYPDKARQIEVDKSELIRLLTMLKLDMKDNNNEQ